MSIRLSVAALLVVLIVAVSANSSQKRDACQAGYFVCKNGTCLKNAWVCDTEDDCGDGSDEVGCPTDCSGPHQFKCTNGKCTPHLFKCDGDDDCGDKSDEAACPV